MREIKFRAWDKERKELLPVKLMDWPEWRVSCDPTHGKAKPFEYGERNSFKNESTDRHILMQYTGLKDENDQEIYEGDCLYAKGNFDGEELIGIVEWDEQDARFEVVGLNGRFEYIPNCCYVKGNIYENAL